MPMASRDSPPMPTSSFGTTDQEKVSAALVKLDFIESRNTKIATRFRHTRDTVPHVDLLWSEDSTPPPLPDGEPFI